MAITGLIIALVVIITVVIVIITVVYWTIPTGQTRIVGYFSAIAAVGILIALISLFITAIFQAQETQNYSISQEVSEDYTTWTNIERQFLGTPNLMRLYKQMYPDNPTIQALPDIPITPEVEADEVHMCQILFQTMDSVNSFVTIQSQAWNDPQNSGWLSAFRSWFTSEIVQQQWLVSRQFYSITTQQFVNKYILNFDSELPVLGAPPPTQLSAPVLAASRQM